MLSIIKAFARYILPTHVKKKIWFCIDRPRYIKDIKKLNIQPHNNTRIFILGVPSHANLGDQAIAIGEIEFLKHKYENIPFYDITDKEVYYAIDHLKKIINIRDLIIIHGGGNMGTIWYNEEVQRFNIINHFPDNKIIIFPQSIYYEQTADGNEKLELSQRIYAGHNDLHMIAREPYSFELMKSYYPKSNVYLAPDIVLYLNRQEPLFDRSGVLLCIREDKEKCVSTGEIDGIRKLLESKTNDIRLSDTVLKDVSEITSKDRDKYLDEKLDEFKRARLVITDRLHGMVFAAITATPCIALTNNYHKVKGLYEWIKHLDYIKYAENTQDISLLINELWDIGKPHCKNDDLRSRFDIICNIIEL